MLFLLIATLFAYTSSDIKPQVTPNCLLKTCSYSDMIISYIYDKKERPLVISKTSLNGKVLTTEKYIYKVDSVEHTIVQGDSELVILNSYKLNEMGFVDTETSTWISKMNSPSVSQYVYEYDSDGYLTHKIGTRNNNVCYEGFFYYDNGNLIKSYLLNGETSFEYYLDKENSSHARNGLFGKGNKISGSPRFSKIRQVV